MSSQLNVSSANELVYMKIEHFAYENQHKTMSRLHCSMIQLKMNLFFENRTFCLRKSNIIFMKDAKESIILVRFYKRREFYMNFFCTRPYINRNQLQWHKVSFLFMLTSLFLKNVEL